MQHGPEETDGMSDVVRTEALPSIGVSLHKVPELCMQGAVTYACADTEEVSGYKCMHVMMEHG